MPLSSKAQIPDTRYTLFVRVPIPRGDFVDPPAAHWNSSKDRSLWKILSSALRGSEIDWHQLAEEFDVSLPFLLQQAAWLYESHFSQVREQLRKVSRPVSSSGSPAPQSNPGSTTTVGQGGLSMRRGGSSGSRAPSSLSLRAARDSPTYRSEGSGPGTPVPQRIYAGSRTSSSNTILQTHKSISASQLGRRVSPKTSRRSLETDRHTHPLDLPDSRRTSYDAQPGSPLRAAPDDSSSDSSSSSDEVPATMARSRAFTRRPRYSTTRGKATLGLLSSADEDDDDDDNDDDSPALLFSNQPRSPTVAQVAPPRSPILPRDPTSIVRRGSAGGPQRKLSTPTPIPNTPPPLTRPRESFPNQDLPSSPISPSSGSPKPSRPARPPLTSSTSTHTNPAPFLSPRQRTTLGGALAGAGGQKDGSSGSPSMGSSFSDLDDASVTQSALEEAYVREMGQGGGSSIGFGAGNGGGGPSKTSLVGRVVGKASRYL
ncbi:MAG: hypothetical protein MMC33_009601 [Icmadophila ericetorum]|nr:hypothetical protein [Icmadophila ericetorum]